MIILYILITLNLLVFIVFGWDKRLSVKHKRRIPESTLLGITFIGGTVGAVLGMLIFRHKIAKMSFLLKFAIIVLVQAICVYFFKKYY
ncbi:hypothetical protein ACM40_19450 [Chryseobacterium sp. BLS98]|jgi:uncharacterized membrane protein YsdA (DUF1294 family)|uniref:DUF1294 domain-containing protein n=1 Tax=Chryseobacterium sp. BLS98 TaxID=885586 RepID=UPI00065A9874|nr:DUF1294 domain-containing protein [Chryseobacterium sp. BLS98]KMQ59116.1 hypothetical protein ACM40_19450 [Chryseobacterium sp. BLS98]